jgi:hypothetical protein
MIVSEAKKFVFIRTPKTAGTSIESAIIRFAIPGTSQLFHWHTAARDACAVLQRWDQYFRFAFVRNPYDLQVSLYNYVRRCGKWHPEYKRVRRYADVSEYVKQHVARLAQRRELRTQTDLLCSSDGVSLVNFIGRFENLHEHFEQICSRIGIRRVTLPHLNSARSPFGRSVLDRTARQIVANAYRRDFELFGYSID